MRPAFAWHRHLLVLGLMIHSIACGSAPAPSSRVVACPPHAERSIFCLLHSPFELIVTASFTGHCAQRTEEPFSVEFVYLGARLGEDHLDVQGLPATSLGSAMLVCESDEILAPPPSYEFAPVSVPAGDTLIRVRYRDRTVHGIVAFPALRVGSDGESVTAGAYLRIWLDANGVVEIDEPTAFRQMGM